MAKRSMGRIKHRHSQRGHTQPLKMEGSGTLTIRVGVARWPHKVTKWGPGQYSRSGSKAGDYVAKACFLRASKLSRCQQVYGNTPTLAIKNALALMSRKLK